MSFLFKSSKKGGPPNANALPPATRDIRSSDGNQAPAAIGSLNGASTAGAAKPGSPTPSAPINSSLNAVQSNDKTAAPRTNVRPEEADRLPMQQTRAPPVDSPYPWSQRRLNFTVSHTNPFPRYGAAVNASASKNGSIYLMGGLINGSKVKGDLWMVEATPGSMTCFPVATTSEGPGPRVGHASLLVGNAFIVFGGDTKMDEGDMLDDTLYLLNTSTKQWSRALPAGPRPPGRYGHTLNILGSKIYIFGGQVEGYFFNDLVAFDLNALQQASNRWEILIQNTIDGGPPHGQIPPARTNHTMVTWNDKLYLFGGTDGVQWFNDVWSYSPHTNSWTQLECIGYIPSPREGHAAALVGDVMYIFGGRTEEGTDLGDLAAFRISSRRWYTFQNMGPSPSPRSGHSMTTVGKQIVVLAGEPSSAPRDPVELGLAYFLDTSKIRYPADNASNQGNANDKIQGAMRRPSSERQPPVGFGAGRGMIAGSPMDSQRGSNSLDRTRSESASRLPRPGQGALPAPSGPPPQQQPPQPRMNNGPPSRQPSRPFSPALEAARTQPVEERSITTPAPQSARASPAPQQNRSAVTSGIEEQGSADSTPRQKPETYQPTSELEGAVARTPSRTRGRDEDDEPEHMPQVRQIQREEVDRPQDSGIGSSPALTQQFDEMSKELDQVKHRNAWYASELALARKAGYQARSTDSPAFDERPEGFGEGERPLVEALLKMKAELARVQSTIDTQSRATAERIAEMEKQRDNAINEAVIAKARLAGSSGEESRGLNGEDKSHEHSKKLATSLTTQAELNRKIASLTQQIETERYSRELAEGTAEAAQKRLAELDQSRQQYSSEIEGLRSELHEAQTEAREALANHADITAQHALLVVDKQEMSGRLERSLADTSSHGSVLAGLKEAVAASSEKSDLLEKQLQSEREQHTTLKGQFADLQTQHDTSRSALDEANRRLAETEELASKHAREAETHRSAVMAGLNKMTEHDYDAHEAADERVTILQQQVLSANALMRQNQASANSASEKLRRAEERIAGLEAYQEQASREGLTVRKQLQQTMKDMQSLSAEKAELETRLQTQLLETNALSVQHNALKDILGERGINASEVRRSRAIDSPNGSTRFSTPDLQRMRELEQQLDASLKNHDEMRAQFEEVSERDEKMKREYEDKLTALDNDHQAAVKYLRGTEKMLSKMRQELQRLKNENGDMKKKLEKVRTAPEEGKRGVDEPPADWETEREKLKKEVEESHDNHKTAMNALESRLTSIQSQLQAAETEREHAKALHATSQSDLSTLQATHTETRGDIERLQRENASLDERARDAEAKVQLLLDQVESSVDNYRRQSRMSVGGAVPLVNGTHARNLSNISSNTSTLQTHSRNISEGGDTYEASESGDGDATRNSLALDSLASELDALRSHWETTNRNYRLSDRFDFDRPAGANGSNGEFSGLSSWRRDLDLGNDDEVEEITTTPTTTDHPAAAAHAEHATSAPAVAEAH
ncbi:hypothetical protein AMS68_003860 [Peltaster fructicola]|uniref:Uncharacterized protein n=1 Tax=Peltaster fructicola TaxID=286661 RepID=A0A6H0XUD9_9PEZI|nr:hypothetical protein AMS68_003860 [Peltaster fructicola]